MEEGGESVVGDRWWGMAVEWWRPDGEGGGHVGRGLVGEVVDQDVQMDGKITTVTTAAGVGESRDVDEKQDEALVRHAASPLRTDPEPIPTF